MPSRLRDAFLPLNIPCQVRGLEELLADTDVFRTKVGANLDWVAENRRSGSPTFVSIICGKTCAGKGKVVVYSTLLSLLTSQIGLPPF